MPTFKAVLLQLNGQATEISLPRLNSTTPNNHRQQLDAILSKELARHPLGISGSPPKAGPDVMVRNCHGWDKAGYSRLSILSPGKIARAAENDDGLAEQVLNLHASKLLSGPNIKPLLPVYGPALIMLEPDEDGEDAQEKDLTVSQVQELLKMVK